MVGGFVGRILRVNLSTRKTATEDIGEGFFRKWLGGYGLGARIIYSEMRAHVNPLAPENILGLTTGILTGTAAPTSSLIVVGKSPLTGGWGDSRCGGFFGPELKFAGYDTVFFYGRAEKPVYVLLSTSDVQVKDASELWGLDTFETEDAMREILGDRKIQVVCIGPAGEKLSLISGIVHDKGRVAARSGLGAVMGSKNLKAVAVRGITKVPVARPSELLELGQKYSRSLRSKEELAGFLKYGTSWSTVPCVMSGDSPVRNWRGVGKTDFPDSQQIAGENVYRYVNRIYTCFGCPIACGAHIELQDSDRVIRGHRPEYETIASFGTLLLNSNLKSIIHANDICNRYGLDTISTGTTIAFAIECFENGIISLEDTDGVQLGWGDTEAIVSLVQMIAERKGFGDILADGVKKAALRIGKGSDKFAMHVGGQEIPMHDPRFAPGYATSYQYDATPGRHTQGSSVMYELPFSIVQVPGFYVPPIEDRYNPHGQGYAHRIAVEFIHVVNCVGICQNVLANWTDGEGAPFLDKFINAVTDWNCNWKELLECGERIACMRQAFNVREGIKPSSHKLPNRVLGIPPLETGPTAGMTIDVETQGREWFREMDWDFESGRPSKEKLRALGLDDVSRDLHEYGTRSTHLLCA